MLIVECLEASSRFVDFVIRHGGWSVSCPELGKDFFCDFVGIPRPCLTDQEVNQRSPLFCLEVLSQSLAA